MSHSPVTWLDEALEELFDQDGQEQTTKAIKRCGMCNAIGGSKDRENSRPETENYEIDGGNHEESGVDEDDGTDDKGKENDTTATRATMSRETMRKNARTRSNAVKRAIVRRKKVETCVTAALQLKARVKANAFTNREKKYLW